MARSRLLQAKAGFFGLKEAGSAGSAGFFRPKAGLRRLTPAYVYTRTCRKPAYAGLRRLRLKEPANAGFAGSFISFGRHGRKPAKAGVSRLLSGQKPAYFGQKEPAFGQKEPASPAPFSFGRHGEGAGESRRSRLLPGQKEPAYTGQKSRLFRPEKKPAFGQKSRLLPWRPTESTSLRGGP